MLFRSRVTFLFVCVLSLLPLFFFLLAFTRESVYVYVYVYVQYAEECEKTALKMHLFSVFFFLFKV